MRLSKLANKLNNLYFPPDILAICFYFFFSLGQSPENDLGKMSKIEMCLGDMICLASNYLRGPPTA